MAENKIEQAITQTRSGLNQIKSDLEAIDTKMISLVEKASKVGQGFKANTPDGIKNVMNQYSKLQKQIDDFAKKQSNLDTRYHDQRKKLELQYTQLFEREQRKRENQVNREASVRRSLQRQKEKELKLLERSSGMYNQIRNRVSVLTKQYNDLAAKKALNNSLSAKEEGFLKGLTTTLNRYQNALKKVDADIGKYSRNVGNYASGFNGLNNAVAQLTREAPAFAMNAQVGFLALSNNIPILADEIQRLIAQNKILQAQGEPTKNVFKSIAAAVFSWQTALSAGIVLLTVYGPEIVKLANDFFDLGKSVDYAEETQKKLNEAAEESEKIYERSSKAVAEEVARLEALRFVAEDVTNSTEKRNDAVDQLVQIYPKYLKNIERDKILNGEIDNVYGEINKKIVQRAKLSVAQQKLEELIAIQLNNEIKKRVEIGSLSEKQINKLLEDFRQREKAQDNYNEQLDEELTQKVKNFDITKKVSEGEVNANLQRRNSIDDVAAKTRAHNQAIDEANEVVEKEIEAVLELINALGGLTSEQQLNTDEREKLDNLVIKRIGYEKDLQKNLEETKKATQELIEEERKRLNVIVGFDLDANGMPTPIIEEQTIQYGYEALERVDPTEITEELTKKVDELRAKYQETGAWAQLSSEQQIEAFRSVFDTFADYYDIDLKKFDFLFDDKMNTIMDWSNAAKEIIGSVLDASLQRYQVELQEAQRARDLIVNNELATEKEKRLARERFEEEERRIKTKQAKRERQNTLIKIAVDTAAAIAATLAPPPLGYGPLLGPATIPIIAGLGAAQAALVASQPLPKFKEGTKVPLADDTLAWVGDGGRKEAITKDGKLLDITPDRPTLAMLPKGAEVQKDASEWINNAIYRMNMSHEGQILSDFMVDKALLSEVSMMRKENKKLSESINRLSKRQPIFKPNVKVELPSEYKI